MDQAAGLRALFAPRAARLVPVVDNPQVQGGEGLIDALVGAYLERGLHVLVVDAGLRAKPASELALVNLAACVESLSAQVDWLDARGLVAHSLDERGSAAGLLARLRDAVPRAEVIVLRAPVAELARVLMHAGEPCRPLLTTDLQAENLREAYAAMKWLRERAGCVVFQLLLAGAPELKLAQRIAQQLADCAERFLGAALPAWAGVPPGRPLSPALRRLARDTLLDRGDAAVAPGHHADWRRAATVEAR